MPTYVFVCKACGFKDGVVSSIAERPERNDCEMCGEPMVRDWKAEIGDWWIEGLAKDRFYYRDKIMANRQRAHEKGLM